jgi:hypothetical protein
MNGDGKREIKALDFAHHDGGNLWSAYFPYPDDDFLEDMQWEVYYTVGGKRVDWFTQSMKKHCVKGREPTLELRFEDREIPPIKPADRDKLSAHLVSPRS